ncbi:MAG: hypothetical protein ACLGIF_08810, partial [Actinomycetes bacterium]
MRRLGRPTSTDAAPELRPDLRLLPTAAAAWAGAWAGTGGAGPQLVAALAAGALAVGVAVARTSARAAAVGLVLVVALVVGWSAHARLSAGPVADLAEREAVVQAVLVITADPTVHAATGSRSDYLVGRARLVELSGRGQGWRVRAPVLVIVSGAGLLAWRGAPVGTTLTTTGQ